MMQDKSLRPVEVETKSTEIKNKKSYEFNLETLRGVAAIFVVISHSTSTDSSVDNGFYPSGVFNYFWPAHFSVLVFFVLSGYVIGIAHKAPLAKNDILLYLKKRFIRLYPIYFVCLVFAILTSADSYNANTIAGHLVMAQGIFTPVIHNIVPVWSLSYEVLFYLLFIPISFFRIKPVYTLCLAFAIGSGLLYCYSTSHAWVLLASSYALGFGFWLCGLVLAKYLANKNTTYSYSYMLVMLLVFLSISVMDASVTLVSKIEIVVFGENSAYFSTNQPALILFRDLGYLPYCLGLIIIFSGKIITHNKFYFIVLLLIPTITIPHVYSQFKQHQLESAAALGFGFYILALLCFIFASGIERLAERIIKALAITGGISYAIYVVHYPILSIFRRVSFFSGTVLSFGLRLGVFLMLCVIISYLLEKRFQPFMRRFL